MDQELTHGDSMRMLTAAITHLLGDRTDYDQDEPLSIMRHVSFRAGVMRHSPVTLTSLACTEIMEADVADLYAACSEVAPKLREARR